MTIKMDQLFIYTPTPPRSLRQFVEFWAARYSWQNEELYTGNITGPHTAKRLEELFRWKIDKRWFASTLPHLQQCFINHRAKAGRLVKELARCESCKAARRFLDQFREGGTIWRIFWLHCWDTRFPIYDQHVHRAMTFILDGGRME